MSLSLSQFQAHTEREFLLDSAISSSLYRSAVQVCSDIEVGYGGEVVTPIHDALNWHYTRFGDQVKPTTHAALFLNEDSSVWQAKLSRAAFKGSERRYAAPTGNGSKPYLPPINAATRAQISQQQDIEIPVQGDFWPLVVRSQEWPLIITEGGKKSLSTLSIGHIAIALYGVNSGYRTKDKLGCPITPELLPELLPFVSGGREVILCFDQDIKPTARRRVTAALHRFGGLLKRAGATVRIAAWDSADGKGIDDLIANKGADAAHQAIASALPLEHWAIQQRLAHRLTVPPRIQVTSRDLSTLVLDHLPDSGILAIAAPKGTGKTKLIAEWTGVERVGLALGHRIALMRNLCQRLGLDYRGDITGAKRAGVIHSGTYRIGVGACVDGLLSINPEDFKGCDLILDEVVQVVRHLLTSSTCARDGKRPALLARFHELIAQARRVIVADADLDNATLHYLQQLRGNEHPVFLIRNDYQSQGYPVRFLEAPDRSTITAQILEAVGELPRGKVLYIPTDSKAGSKDLTHLLLEQHPQLRILTINSETSGGQDEREFIQTPDLVLERGDYDIIICTPSLATGVSIEVRGIVHAVYGIFQGVSSTDADMAQALIRVREPAPRIIWCSRTGSNFSRVSRSTNPIELRSHLMSRTTATVSLTRSQLREDSLNAIQGYDWQADPHLQMWSIIEAERNRSMLSLRTALLVRLKHEGHQVTVEEHPSNQALKTLLKDSREAIAQLDAESLVNAPDYTYAQVIELQNREHLSSEQQRGMAKFYFKEFYGIDALTVDEVLADKQGRRRAELRSLEAQLYPETAIARDISSIDKQLEQEANWGGHICPWDVGDIELRRWLREKLGLNDFLKPNWEWTKLDLLPYAERARQLTKQVKVALKMTITNAMSDVQVVHQLLSQMGIKTAFRWSRSAPELEGEKVRVYRLDPGQWAEAIAILERRKAQREALKPDGSPAPLNHSVAVVDPTQHREANGSDCLFQVGDVVLFGTSMRQWQVIAHEPGAVRLRIVTGSGLSTEVVKPLRDIRPA